MDRQLTGSTPARLAGMVGMLLAALGPLSVADAQPGEAPSTQPAGEDKPREKELSPQEQALADGWRYIRVANWPRATETLEGLKSSTSDREIAAEATFALGHLWHHRKRGTDLSRAKDHYRTVLTDYAGTRVAPWAALTLARMVSLPENEPEEEAGRQRIRREARALYREIIEDYPEHIVATEATLRLALTYLQQVGNTEAENQGAQLLLDYLQKRPKNYLASSMRVLLGQMYQHRGQQARARREDEKADEHYARAVEQYAAADEAGIPGQGERATMYFRIGQIAERELEDYKLAARWYAKIVGEMKRDQKYYVAKQYLDRLRREHGVAVGGAEGEPGGAGEGDSRGREQE